MTSLELIRSLFRYSDWATETVLSAAAGLTDAQLDAPFDMGPGSLRRTLEHIHHFEAVYLERWQGRGATGWPAYEPGLALATLLERFHAAWRGRERYFVALTEAELDKTIRWQDSRGGWFSAPMTLALVQVANHSTHHRAQAVNMIRRLSGVSVEVDFMMQVRTPVAG